MENPGNNPRPNPERDAAIKRMLYDALLQEKARKEALRKKAAKEKELEAKKKKEEEEKEKEEDFTVKLIVSGLTADLRDGVSDVVGKEKFEEALISTWQRVNIFARKYVLQWDKLQLHKAYQEWLSYESPALTDTRIEILKLLEDVAKEKKCFGYVRSGSEHEAVSPLQLAPLLADEVLEENAEIGKRYGELIKRNESWNLDLLNRQQLEEEKAAWEVLQQKNNLPPLSAYDSQKANSYSLLARAVFMASALVEDKLKTLDQRIQEREQQERERAQQAREREAELQRAKDLYQAQQSTNAPTDIRSQMKQLPELAEIKRMNELRELNTQLLNQAFGRAESADFLIRNESPSGKVYKDNYAETIAQVQGQSWDNFSGWSDEARDTLIQQLISSEKNPIKDPNIARRVLIAFLLRGRSADEARQWLIDTQENVLDVLDALGILYSDETVFTIFDPLKDSREARKERRYQRSDPQDREDLAWQMAHRHEHFRQDGPYPMLHQIVKKQQENGRIKFSFEERVNSANMVMWLRENFYAQHDNDSMNRVNLNNVMLEKQIGGIPLGKILLPGVQMMKSRYGDSEEDAALQAQMTVETKVFDFLRNFMIDLIDNQANEKGSLQETLKGIFFKNDLTRPIFRETLLAHIHKMAEAFGTGDGKMGATINTIYKSYHSISNPRRLAEILHVSNLDELFGKKNLARVQEKLLRQGQIPSYVYDLSKARYHFDLNDEKHREKFIQMFNFFGDRNFSEHMKAVVRTIIKERAAELHGLRDTIHGVDVSTNKDLSELLALALAHMLGPKQELDLGSGGWDFLVKLRGDYRKKQASGDRAGTFGDLRTMEQFRNLLVPAMYAIRTTSKSEKGSKSIWELIDEIGEFRNRREAPLVDEVNRMDLSVEIKKKEAELRARYEPNSEWMMQNGTKILEIAEREAKQEARDKLMQQRLLNTTDFRSEYEKLVGQFIFDYDASQVYFTDQVTRAFEIDERIRGAKELKFDNYFIHDHLLGTVFEQEKFQGDFSKLGTAVRYFTDAKYRLDEIIEVYNKETKQKDFRYLGETLFGYELVNIPNFWMTEDPRAEYHGHGKWVVPSEPYITKDGKKKWKYEKYTGEVYEGVIDWKKVNRNRRMLRKRWMEVLIVGMMLQHRMLTEWASSPRYTSAVVNKMWEGIAKIVGEVDTSQFSMKNTRVLSHYFSKEQIERMREESGTSEVKLAAIELIIGGLFGRDHKGEEGLFKGLGEALAMFFSSVVKNPAR